MFGLRYYVKYDDFDEKFYSIDGYYAIYDKDNEDEIIWVDCTEEQLQIFINALNESVGEIISGF